VRHADLTAEDVATMTRQAQPEAAPERISEQEINALFHDNSPSLNSVEVPF